MVRKKTSKRKIESYAHEGKERANNPPVGLVTPKTDPDAGRKKTYTYDPPLDPHLAPQLHWAGKAEHTSFDVPTVSLHVHERIDPRTIVEAVRKHNGNGGQRSLFEQERKIPLRQEIEFYKHSHNWSNRLIAGDSLLVMNSLLQKENMAGKVQCVYIDPPYGIKYGSNFQPFVNKRDVKDGKDEDLSTEPEMIKAFRDTWEWKIHSYLSYLRDRLLLARELLSDSGSVFVQISDENVHHVREIMDEVFGAGNFVSLISYRTKSRPLGTKFLEAMSDKLIWYCRSIEQMKYRQIYEDKNVEGNTIWKWAELPNSTTRQLTKEEIDNHKLIPSKTRIFRSADLRPAGFNPSFTYSYKFAGKVFHPPGNSSWLTSKERMKVLDEKGYLFTTGKILERKIYLDEFPVQPLTNLWHDTVGTSDKRFVVQTAEKIIQRCILMTTDPGDLVFDPTCGSGTTAFVAEKWGRRWITCDTSRVATTLAKQRLMTATFDYYKLAYPDEGVGSGFEYKKVPHITLKSIANNEPPATETLYDQPLKDTKRARVTGPFTVEAVPSPTVQPIDDITDPDPAAADESVARTGETLRQHEWRDELLKVGIRGKGGQRISFSRIEPLPCHWLHADAETRPDDSGVDEITEAAETAYKPRRAVVSFGPEHAPLEQRQV